jgi:hypothetical protein
MFGDKPRGTRGGTMTTKRTLTRLEAAAVAAAALLGAAAAVGYGTLAGGDAGAATAAATAPPRPTPASNDGRVGEQPPSADEFGRHLVVVTNARAAADGDAKRIGQTDCVQPVPGRYMCSYSVREQGRPTACHLMQARWTPNAASTITVTLAGTTKRCGSLRDALASLD